jgi:nitrogen fixation protein NifU and related proteins
MADPKELYDSVVMDHIRSARNYGVPPSFDDRAAGLNRLCGDELTVYVERVGDVLSRAHFECSCCGVSMASASIMTELVSGRAIEEVRRLVEDTVAVLKSGGARTDAEHPTDYQALMSAMTEFPSRLNCAMLPWRTLEAALEGKSEVTV